MKKVKVLIVDDSMLIRDILTEILSASPEIDVVGSAEDPYQARQMIKDLNPDVLTLDVEMPKMNGIAFLRNLMRLRPMPVLMISTLTTEGSHVTMQALELGAVDFIEKPKNLGLMMSEYGQQIRDRVLSTATVSLEKLQAFQDRLRASSQDAKRKTNPPVVAIGNKVTARQLLAVGGSTGSLEALRYLLEQVTFVGNEALVVSLHLPGKFTKSYAERLDGLLPLKVVEASHGDIVREGHIYIAQGGRHMEIKQRGSGFQIVISDSEPVNLHRPSVDVLFKSVANMGNKNVTGLLLTGMGKDGARGLLEMASVGMQTYAQDEQSSVIWGMPGRAAELGAVANDNILSLEQLANRFAKIFNR
ncbi:MAG: chemotaxis response regulator protein-glutamate methylesterase [Aestuariibacter sp.]